MSNKSRASQKAKKAAKRQNARLNRNIAVKDIESVSVSSVRNYPTGGVSMMSIVSLPNGGWRNNVYESDIQFSFINHLGHLLDANVNANVENGCTETRALNGVRDVMNQHGATYRAAVAEVAEDINKWFDVKLIVNNPISFFVEDDFVIIKEEDVALSVRAA